MFGGFGNFFVCRACYYLLHDWLDHSRFVKATDLDFAEEFYEVVNSREKGRREFSRLLQSYNIWKTSRYWQRKFAVDRL